MWRKEEYKISGYVVKEYPKESGRIKGWNYAGRDAKKRKKERYTQKKTHKRRYTHIKRLHTKLHKKENDSY